MKDSAKAFLNELLRLNISREDIETAKGVFSACPDVKLMRRTDSFGNTLMLGKIEGRRRLVRQNKMVGCHHRLNGHESE